MKDTEKALRWYCKRNDKRVPELNIHEKHCISMMYEYAKYYHEQQVKSVDLADVGGNEVALPTNDDVNTDSALNMGRTLDAGRQ